MKPKMFKVSTKDMQLCDFLVENSNCLIALGNEVNEEDLIQLFLKKEGILYLKNLQVPQEVLDLQKANPIAESKTVFAMTNESAINVEELQQWIHFVMAGYKFSLTLKANSVKAAVIRFEMALRLTNPDFKMDMIEKISSQIFNFVIVLNRAHNNELVVDIYTIDESTNDYVPCIISDFHTYKETTTPINSDLINRLRRRGVSLDTLKNFKLIENQI